MTIFNSENETHCLNNICLLKKTPELEDPHLTSLSIERGMIACVKYEENLNKKNTQTSQV